MLPVSEIGEVAAFARRSGDAWFLAICNGPAARAIAVSLEFLGEGAYRAVAVKDRKDDDASVDIEESASAARDTTLKIELNAGGGFIARYSRN